MLQIRSLKYQLTSALYVAKANEQGDATSQYSKVQTSIDELESIERMLKPSYDFSSLSHPHTVKLTTLETLCYRGLLSCHYVVLDRLVQAENALSK